MCGEREAKDEPGIHELVGEVLINWLDIPRLQKPGKRVRNIEFAALRQMSQICYTALPIEEQEYPAFPARELSCKCLCRYGRDNLEYKCCLKNPFPRAKFPHNPSRPSS